MHLSFAEGVPFSRVHFQVPYSLEFLVGWLEKLPKNILPNAGFHGDESNGRIGNKITFNKQKLETVKFGRGIPQLKDLLTMVFNQLLCGNFLDYWQLAVEPSKTSVTERLSKMDHSKNGPSSWNLRVPPNATVPPRKQGLLDRLLGDGDA